MRRILLRLSVVALIAGLTACAADAPLPTPPTGSGTPGSTALQVSLFTTNANPTAGFCTLVQAIVSLNGGSVPDGTGVAFSADFGVFQENSLPVVSKVTQNSSAFTAICSTIVGVAKVKATVTIGNNTGSATISISFLPSAQAVPFYSFCSPGFGLNTGGTSLTITGGRFFGDASSTRVRFTSLGVTREGVVQAVTDTTVKVLTPAFPEALSPSVPVDIAITFGTNTGSPITISAPNCFVYGTAAGDQPSITAVLPSTGTNDGGTRVTIVGSGFQGPMQVFFGTVEAPPPTSVSYNQIIVYSPAASGPGLINLNKAVDIRVRNTTSGKETTSVGGAFRFVTALQITAISNNVQSIDQPFSQVTIFGNGFSSPMAVSLAGIGASISSVSSTELVVVPGSPFVSSCASLSGLVHVVNVANGDFADGPTFTYLVAGPSINGVSPSQAQWSPGLTLTIFGFGFPTTTSDISVKVGTRTAAVLSSSTNSITIQVPDNAVTTSPACGTGQPPGTQVGLEIDDVVVTNRRTTCTTTATGAFTYTRPCV